MSLLGRRSKRVLDPSEPKHSLRKARQGCLAADARTEPGAAQRRSPSPLDGRTGAPGRAQRLCRALPSDAGAGTPGASPEASNLPGACAPAGEDAGVGRVVPGEGRARAEEARPRESAARRAPSGFPLLPDGLQSPRQTWPRDVGGRIPGLATSSRPEGPGLSPPAPLGSAPGAAAPPGGASFCSLSASRSSHTKIAPARPPPTSRADQTAPMAERLPLRGPTARDGARVPPAEPHLPRGPGGRRSCAEPVLGA